MQIKILTLSRSDESGRGYVSFKIPNLQILTVIWVFFIMQIEENQDERQGKMLLHTEHSLLNLLQNMPGVIRVHDFFTEACKHESEVGFFNSD